MPVAASSAPTATATAVKKSKAGAVFTDWETDPAEIKLTIPPYSEIWAVSSDRGPILAWNGKVIRTTCIRGRNRREILGPKRLKWKGWELKEIFKTLPSALTKSIVFGRSARGVRCSG